MDSAEQLVPAVESAFARLHLQMRNLERTLVTRLSELAGPNATSSNSEEQLLKVKQYRRELKVLKEQKQALRKSPERKIGQVLLAPYRLPERLIRQSGRNYPRSTAGSRRSERISGMAAAPRARSVRLGPNATGGACVRVPTTH
jgi:hypothetical protein